MSNSVFQSVMVQLKDLTDRAFGVVDTDGCVISCTDMSLLGERWTDAALKIPVRCSAGSPSLLPNSRPETVTVPRVVTAAKDTFLLF